MSNNPIFRPCPFCGYEYPAMHGGPLVDYYWNVYCQICQCRGPVTKDHDQALAVWNGWTAKKKDWRKFKENTDANQTREQSTISGEKESVIKEEKQNETTIRSEKASMDSGQK